MVKQWLAMAVALAVVSQGVARGEGAPTAGVTFVGHRTAPGAHIDTPEAGDRVLVATDERVSAELVDKNAGELNIDPSPIEAGAEQIARPEIQGARYQQSAHQARARATVVLAVVVGTAIVLAALGLRFR